jgi:hypothetical protein
MDLFLDCEWADVLASELVSIALVSADGQKVFYAERDPLPADPTPWVQTVVYPLLDRGERAMDDTRMTLAIRNFLASINAPRIHYDFGADRSLCQYVVDGFDMPQPPGSPPFDLEWQRCDDLQKAIEQWWHSHPEARSKRHHALTDAQAFRAACIDQSSTDA